jgi:excisionase family DNA binding protein
MATSTRDDVLQQLRDGVTALTESDNWRRFLDVQARFHHYSWGNTLLIAQQRPEATKVAGYRTWQTLGRQVRKGEKAIMILAPLVHKVQGDGQDGTEERVVRGFKSVPVFDLGQTDGNDLPQLAHRLQGNGAADALQHLRTVTADLGYRIDVTEFPGEKNGECNFHERVIRLRTGIAPAQMVKTLGHELAHAILHNPDEQQDRQLSRELAELEAESVAYVICRDFNIDSGEYSFGYIAGWAGDGERARQAIESSAAQIHRAVHAIMHSLDSPEQATAAEVPAPPSRHVEVLSDEIRGPMSVGNGGESWPEPLHHVNGKTVPSLLLKVPEACELLRVSRAQLYVLANKQHEIEMVHIGKLCRVPRASIEAYVERLRNTASLQRPLAAPSLTVASEGLR